MSQAHSIHDASPQSTRIGSYAEEYVAPHRHHHQIPRNKLQLEAVYRRTEIRISSCTDSIFSILNYNTDNDETQYVERSDGLTEHGRIFPAHFACDNCQAKKVERTTPTSTLVANILALNAMAKSKAVFGAMLRLSAARTPGTATKGNASESTTPTRELDPSTKPTARIRYRAINADHRKATSKQGRSPKVLQIHHVIQWAMIGVSNTRMLEIGTS